MVVDCLLPGKVRKLGGATTYLSERRPVKTSAGDCELRGGEYTAYDRANYATALRIWLPLAEKNDREAQTFVGEIFEKGLGVGSDPAAAAQWYRRAADQGYARAQINLGYLYEKGHGVAADPVEALNWYRKAAGISEAIVLESDATAQIESRESEIDALRRDLDAARGQLDKLQRDRDKLKRDSQRLKRERDAAGAAQDLSRVAALEAELAQRDREAVQREAEIRQREQTILEYQNQLVDVHKTALTEIRRADSEIAEARAAKADAEADAAERIAQADKTVDAARRAELAALKAEAAANASLEVASALSIARSSRAQFGSYHALVIGNQKYRSLPKLDTSLADAAEVSRVLAGRYGFKVTTLTDATRHDTLSALDKLRKTLTEKDNLLVYYAGRGELDRTSLRAHWLPVDADAQSDANWISTAAITDILNAMSARHVMLVVDSCYSAAMTRSSIARQDAGKSDEARLSGLEAMAKSRSRTVLTSGGLQPVSEGGGGAHSLFAKEFLNVLNLVDEPVEGRRLFQALSARVLQAALRVRIDQKPGYGPMRFAGHESGDFLFIPGS